MANDYPNLVQRMAQMSDDIHLLDEAYAATLSGRFNAQVIKACLPEKYQASAHSLPLLVLRTAKEIDVKEQIQIWGVAMEKASAALACFETLQVLSSRQVYPVKRGDILDADSQKNLELCLISLRTAFNNIVKNIIESRQSKPIVNLLSGSQTAIIAQAQATQNITRFYDSESGHLLPHLIEMDKKNLFTRLRTETIRYMGLELDHIQAHFNAAQHRHDNVTTMRIYEGQELPATQKIVRLMSNETDKVQVQLDDMKFKLADVITVITRDIPDIQSNKPFPSLTFSSVF